MMEAKCQEMGVMPHEISKLATNELIPLDQLRVYEHQFVVMELQHLLSSVMMEQ